MNIRVIGDSLLVLPDKVAADYRGVLVLPDSAIERTECRLATVIACGGGAVRKSPKGKAWFEEMPYKPGDRVILNPWVGRWGSTQSVLVKRPEEYGLPDRTMAVKLREILGCVEEETAAENVSA